VEIERLVIIIIIIIIIIIQSCALYCSVVFLITVQLLYIFCVLKTFWIYVSVRSMLKFSVAMLFPVIISLMRVLLMQFLNLVVCLACYILV
jgi:hypothetical protein